MHSISNPPLQGHRLDLAEATNGHELQHTRVFLLLAGQQAVRVATASPFWRHAGRNVILRGPLSRRETPVSAEEQSTEQVIEQALATSAHREASTLAASTPLCLASRPLPREQLAALQAVGKLECVAFVAVCCIRQVKPAPEEYLHH